MFAKDFYSTESKSFILLSLISEQELQNCLSQFSDYDKKIIAAQKFTGNLGEIVTFYNDKGEIEKIYVGTKDGNEYLALAHAALKLGCGYYKLEQKINSDILLSWSLAQYQFDSFKLNKKQPNVLLINQRELEEVLPMAEAIFSTRNLINLPANICNPEYLTDTLNKLAKSYKANFKQWVGDKLLKNNFPAIFAVGQAANIPPRLLSLTWGSKSHPLITLIGKGVCFDSGGLDIKPAEYMRLMKKDMGGAAHVIGLAQWIMSKNLPIRLQVLIPAVENAIGSNAYRPGDILTMRNGMTVEVDNTDAEGRLILADALVKACEDKPELIIDFATLTGAARAAVGTDIAAMFTNADEVAKELEKAAYLVNDPVLRMPLFKEYEKLLESNIADLSNCAKTPFAGAITAALFLQKFISDIDWVHFDIMAFNVFSRPGKPEGGEAMGLQMVAKYLETKYCAN